MRCLAFSSVSNPENWRFHPRPGSLFRDRALLSRRRTIRGQAPARCVMRDRGRALLLRRPVRCGAPHQAGARRQHRQHRPGGENRNRHGNPGPEPFGLTHRAHTTLRSPLTLRLNRASLSGRFLSPAAQLLNGGNRAAGSTRSGFAHGGDRPDACHCNAVSTGTLADSIAVGPAAFLSQPLSRTPPPVAQRLSPWPNCVLRQPPTSRSQLR